MKITQKKGEIRVKDLRINLKQVIEEELEKLPDHLKQLDPLERVNVIVKLLPYVFPKVNTVHYKEDESFNGFEF
ncbi:hypothetical protein N8085_02555 [Salibacteraceae bacterium]|nr:hypothetical protein [Salibacteraceae bacterium]